MQPVKLIKIIKNKTKIKVYYEIRRMYFVFNFHMIYYSEIYIYSCVYLLCLH